MSKIRDFVAWCGGCGHDAHGMVRRVIVVAMDTRDAAGPQIRGWGRFARDLAAAVRELPDVELRELPGTGWPGPEALWEQIGFPAAARGAAVLHAPNVFLPLRRPCPGVVTIHDLAFEEYPEDFIPRTRAKFRWIAPRAARSAQRVMCGSAFTRDDICERYGVDPGKVDVIGNAPSLPVGDAPVGDGDPYLLGRGRPAWQEELAAPGAGVAGGAARAGLPAGRSPATATRPSCVRSASRSRVTSTTRASTRSCAARPCLVHPSLYEGWGLVVAEAIERGMRVAAAGNTSLPEAGGGQAVYFDPFDVDAIGAAVDEALAGPAPQPIARTWADVALETADVYRRAAAA